ncbi:MAG: CbiQ family ECF transporter T component [Mariprofundaceae bacterium]|nr:CbiQ family ECF transporter T component [Mariprofundaceae bacterium]
MARLCFALGLFASVLLAGKAVLVYMMLLSTLLVLLHWLNASWQPVWRAARLLLWLLIPIFLLHMAFTPGRLIWPGGIISVSYEGLQQGLLLAVRLCTLFYAGMLLSRALTRAEWVSACLNTPVLGPLLLPYIALSSPIRGLVDECIAQARKGTGYPDMPRIRGLLLTMTRLMQQVWNGAAQEARSVGGQWDELSRPDSSLMQAGQGYGSFSVLLALGGISMPVALWIL